MTSTADTLEENAAMPKRDLGTLTMDAILSALKQLSISPDASGTAALFVGKLAIVTTGTQVQLPSKRCANGVVVKAAKGNAGTVLIGAKGVANDATSTGNAYELAAGEPISIAVSDTSQIWINGTANDYVSFIGN